MELLASERVGRLAVNVAGRPQIFPVNHALDESGALIVETRPGIKLAAALNTSRLRGQPQPVQGSGSRNGVERGRPRSRLWATDAESLRLAGHPVQSWVAGRSGEAPKYTLRIHPTLVSGRRIAGSHGTGPIARRR